MKAIAIENSGPDYRLALHDVADPSPDAGEILIKVAAAGLNRADLLQAQGHYPPPPGAPETLGMEVSGTVAALGDGVAGWQIGDPVCALLGGGGYAEYARAPQTSVLPIPAGIALADAAALPEAIITVWANVMVAAQLKAGETVLVHGGSSGIGTAAIQMLSALGHTVFTTAGGPAKCAACETLGAHRAIDYKTEDFVAVVKDATGGKGVDVILDMVGGDYIQRNMHAASVWGRIVNIAYQKGMTAEVNFAPMLMKRLSLLATTLRSRTPAEKAALRDAVQQTVWPLLAAGRVRPVIDRKFPLAEAHAAHRRMAEGAHIGKILLVL